MSGWQTIYLDTVNEANARALAALNGLQNRVVLLLTDRHQFDCAWQFGARKHHRTGIGEGQGDQML